MAAVHTAVETTPHVGLAVVADYPPSVAHMGAWTTSCPPAQCTAPDDAFLRWTLAERKMIIQKYGAPGGSHSPHATLLSDVPADDSDSLPTLEECTDEYDDTEVSVPFSSVAFSSSLTLGRNLSQFWVVDSACSINLTAFKSDFVRFTPPPLPRALEGLVLTPKAVAPSGFQSGLPMAGLFTALSMRCTPLTCPLALLSASADYLVPAGCRPTAAVNSSSPLTLTMVHLWFLHVWVC
jgi:hypothetical protein